MPSLLKLNQRLIENRQNRRKRERQPGRDVDILKQIGANLRPDQQAMVDSFKRFNFVCCHRRWGKSHALLAYLFHRAWWCPSERGKYGYFTAVRGQTLLSIKETVESMVSRIPGASMRKKDQAVYITIPTRVNGEAVIILDGLNHTRQRGAGWDGLILDECAEILEAKWTAELYPALTDQVKAGVDGLGRMNQFVVLSGTPIGRNWFYRWYQRAKCWSVGEPYRIVDKLTGAEEFEHDEDWTCTYLPLSTTKMLSKAEAARAERMLGEEGFLREFELVWNAAAKGSFFGKELRRLRDKEQIGSFPHISELPVHTAWDLGLSKTVVWFFQLPSGRARFIDAISCEEEDFDWYLDYLLPKRAKDRGYAYGTHRFPHDAVNQEYGGYDREMAIEGALDRHKMGDYTIVKRHNPLKAGHDAIRWLLPRSQFHEPMCEEELDCMAMYRKKENVNLDTFTGPVEDSSVHAVDAYRQAAYDLRHSMAA